MLVLGRRIGERLYINGGEIVVEIVDIRGDTVRIGITAPREIPVYREEIFRLLKAKEAALPKVFTHPTSEEVEIDGWKVIDAKEPIE